MGTVLCSLKHTNSSPPEQNGRHFADEMFIRIFSNENVLIPNKISLKYITWGPIDNMSALVQITAWRRPGDKPLSEPLLTQFTDAYELAGRCGWHVYDMHDIISSWQLLKGLATGMAWCLRSEIQMIFSNQRGGGEEYRWGRGLRHIFVLSSFVINVRLG